MKSNNAEEIKKYLASAKERIESAALLKDGGKYNDAVSRVYYSFFDAATAALLSKELTAKTHHGLIILFDNNFIKNGIIDSSFGRWLRRAKEAREEADYEVYKKFDEEFVESAITAATDFVAEIERVIRAEEK